MSRSMTSQELAILRSDGQAAKLFAMVDQPVTVYACRVNQTFPTHDKIAQITYNSATGNLSDVIPGMTVLVGSSSGAWDKGIARVRKTWTSSVGYIGETSEIAWENGLYLTVIDEFAIWQRHVRMIGETPYMDYDIPYSDQHSNIDPIVVMGPDRVVKLTGASAVINLDASQSWVIGSAITQYAWGVVRGSGSLSNANTATPALTITNTGRILLRCVVTAANGKSGVGYRTVYVYNDSNPPVEVELDDLSGSIERGGFEFSIRLPVTPSVTLRDYAKVVLFAEDMPSSIGAVAGAENILAIGWLNEKECVIDEHSGHAILSIKGAQYWLERSMAYPTGLEHTGGTPAAWTQIQNLTVDKALWHLLYWRTTLPLCVDLFLTGDSRQASLLQAVGTLWQQINIIATESILADAACDPYSRLFVRIHPNFIKPADRNFPVIMTLTRDDFEQLEIQTKSSGVNQAEVSGVDQTGKPILARAPGTVYGRWGSVVSRDRLLFSSSQQAIDLAGLIAEREKQKFNFVFHLTAANRFITLMPYAFLELTIQAGDTPAKISFTGNVIPDEVHINHRNGALSMTVSAEPEISGLQGMTYIIPALPIIGTPEWNIPDLKLPTWPALTPGSFAPPLIPGDDPLPPEEDDSCPVSAPANGPYIWSLRYTLFGNSNYKIDIPISANIRSENHDNKTVWGVRGRFLKLNESTQVWEEISENNWWNIYAYNSAGQRVATGLKDAVSDLRYRTGTFQPPAAVKIAYIGVEIEADLLRPSSVAALVSAQHFWDNGNITQPELTWGYYGAGIWAYARNGILNAVYSDRSYLWIRFLDDLETDTYIIEQHVFGVRPITTSIPYVQGIITTSGWTWELLWQETLSNNPFATPKWLWETGKTTTVYTAKNYIVAGFGLGGAGQIVMDQFIYVWRKLRYKIELEQVELWNVCPVGG